MNSKLGVDSLSADGLRRVRCAPELIQRWKNRLGVRLIEPMTQLNPLLEAGAIGIVLEFFGPRGDQQWQIEFAMIGTFNIPLAALESMDQDFDSDLRRWHNERLHDLTKNAKEAVLCTTRHNEYRTLHVWLKDGRREVAMDQEEAEHLVRLLKQLQVPINHERW